MPNPAMSPVVQEAMKRRQQGGSVPELNQASPGASMANPVPQPMPQSEMTKASSPQGSQAPQQPKWQPQTQDDMIVATLIEKTKNNDKLRKEQSQMAASPAPQMPQNGQGGGGFSLSSGFQQPMPINQMQGDYNLGLGKDYSGLNGYGKGF